MVALAGATGSGKSSLFNALSGTDLATVGVRRPTTAHAMAATWGEDAAGDLLDWLKIPRRHALERDPETAEALDGLVLLDLPDHDSTERQHRMEVDRLVQLVDMLIWVVDPQKYADAALHDRYLIPLAQHAGVMMIALNQADRLAPAERERCLADLRRLLASRGPARGRRARGLGGDRGGDGGAAGAAGPTDRRQADRGAPAGRRCRGRGRQAADRQRHDGGHTAQPPRSARSPRQIAEAAGVPVVTEAVGQAWRLRGGLATGWPVLAWVAKFKPDPLRRLHLDRLGAGRKRPEIDPAQVGRTLVAGHLRGAEGAGGHRAADLGRPGRRRLDPRLGRRRPAGRPLRPRTRLPDRVDRAIATTDLDLAGHRRWWQVVRVLQWLLVATVVAGLGWLGAAFVLAYLQLPPLPEVRWWGFPAPTVLVLGGVLAGLLVAGLARIGVEVGARRRTARARQVLRAAIAKVTGELVVAPVRAEQERYEQARQALERAATALILLTGL